METLAMYLPDIDLHEAKTISEAGELMERYGADARLLAGGTDLLVDLKTGRVSARHLVSVNRIDAMRGLFAKDNALRIGARPHRSGTFSRDRRRHAGHGLSADSQRSHGRGEHHQRGALC